MKIKTFNASKNEEIKKKILKCWVEGEERNEQQENIKGIIRICRKRSEFMFDIYYRHHKIIIYYKMPFFVILYLYIFF